MRDVTATTIDEYRCEIELLSPGTIGNVISRVLEMEISTENFHFCTGNGCWVDYREII